MKIIRTIKEMKEFRNNLLGKTVGFVPTMGYLHEGHLSLVKKSKEENNITVVSIFVNPTQFGVNEDLDKYPRDFEKDEKLLQELSVDAIFFPNVDEMYPSGYLTYCEVENITNKLCGMSRPTHFRGVTTVVLKLFNIIRPDRAYFGQKDAQQLIVIRKMVKDLNLDVEVIGMPIIRETDGLAKSSRNIYLNETQRENATVLYQSLSFSKQMIENGEKNTEVIKQKIKDTISHTPGCEIGYVEIVDINSLEEVQAINNNALIALAVKFGATRLIDNIIIDN